ncbi:hypothetical protein PIB30_097771 [Stylosanthes scabra]|uniref:Retrotransposon gag domain-containing protein n=1 Tax=Stylosanthes scabra TaxID=79078 RepID=A0ABU6VWQ1_9FABA|nr:hypothetical protein [Stylosanthes scabra]
MVKRVEEFARKKQAILDEAEKREKDRQEKLNGRVLTLVDNDSKTAESKDHTWKPSTVVTKYPDERKKDALTWFNSLPPNIIESFSNLADSFMKNFTTRRRLSKTCLNLYSVVQKSKETLRSYLDRFNTECTQIEGLQSQAALMALVEGLREAHLF